LLQRGISRMQRFAGAGAGRKYYFCVFSSSHNQPSLPMTARTAQTMSAATLSQQALPTIPAGQTTVLTVDELNRIKTTLLHAEAKTKGSHILSEAGIPTLPSIHFYRIIFFWYVFISNLLKTGRKAARATQGYE
jgi:hypothetical protein